MGGIGTGNGHRKQAQLNKYLFHYEQTKVNKKAYSFMASYYIELLSLSYLVVSTLLNTKRPKGKCEGKLQGRIGTQGDPCSHYRE